MEGTLVLSSNQGIYAIEDPVCGLDLTTGQRIEVCLGDQWIAGRIEYNPDPIYVTLGPQTFSEASQMASKPKAIAGYYFVDGHGEVVGLCVGMHVRTLE